MASLAETLGAQSIDVGGGVSEGLDKGLKAGINLATAKEQVDSAKLKVEEQKTELMLKQANTANSLLSNLVKMNPQYAKKAVKNIRERFIQLGLDPDIADLAISDDQYRKNIAAMTAAASGILTKDPKRAANYIQGLRDAGVADSAIQEFVMNEQRMSQQTKIEQMGNASAERIAGMGMDKLDRKEDAALAKEKRAEFKKLDDDFASVDKLIKDIESAQSALSGYSRKSKLGGTGALATVAGAKKFFDQETEALDSKFNNISLDSMVKMFAGMSKAVDTNAERRIFESTQSSITLDDATNKEILARKLEAAKAMKEKILNAKKGIGAIEASGELEAGAKPQVPAPEADADIEAKLKNLPAGADVNKARAALMKAKQSSQAKK